MAGCYSACLQLHCRTQRPSVPNLFVRGSQILHQPTCIIHSQNISSVLSPKNGYFSPLIIYSTTCQQRISRLSSNHKRFLWGEKKLSHNLSVEKAQKKGWRDCPRRILQDLTVHLSHVAGTFHLLCGRIFIIWHGFLGRFTWLVEGKQQQLQPTWQQQRRHCRFTAVSVMIVHRWHETNPKWCVWPFLPSASVSVCLHTLINQASCDAIHFKTTATPLPSRVYLSFSLHSLVFFVVFNSEYYLFKVTHCHPQSNHASRQWTWAVHWKDLTFYEVSVNFKAACPTHQQPSTVRGL